MFYCKTTRRQFLISLRGFSLALPFMPSILPKAFAAGERSKRFICVFHGNGTEADKFWPTNIPLNSYAGGERGVLTNSNNPLSEILGSPFASVKDKMTIIWGLYREKMETNWHGHNPMICLTGANMPDHSGGTGKYIGKYQAWPSLDQVLAYSNKVYPQAPPLRSLHLLSRRKDGSMIRDRRRTVSFKAVGGEFVDIPHERDPRAVFDRLFGGQTMGVTGSSVPANYKKVVDKIIKEYKSLKSNRRISSADKVALDVHMEHLNELEKNIISAPSPVNCTSLPRPGGYDIEFKDKQLVDKFVSNHIDLLVSAIRCQMTNVATFMLNTPTDGERYAFLPGYRNYSFHQESHYGDDGPGSRSSHIIEIHKWLLSKVAELVTKLDVSEGGGATFLDNSLVMLTNSQGAGNHSPENIPVILFGSAGGKVRTNQYIRLKDKPAYNQLLVTAAQAMGLSPSEYHQAGRIGFGTYRYESGPSDAPIPGVLV